MSLSSIIKQLQFLNSDAFLETLEKATSLLQEETGKIGNLRIIGHLVELEPIGEAIVISDLHGDSKSLTSILHTSRFVQRAMKDRNLLLVFLGDYGDRGANSAEVYYLILKLKLAFPEQIVLLRGNHESPIDLIASPHDLPMQLQQRFKTKGQEAYFKIRELWNYLHSAILVKDTYLMLHGGLPPSLSSVDELAMAHETHPIKRFMEDLLWSDPDELVDIHLPSPRGAGNLFGSKVTDEILQKINAKILIRGHEPCDEGFKLNHKSKVLTLFSRKGLPYNNSFGAYLDFHLSKQLTNATQLVSRIHKF